MQKDRLLFFTSLFSHPVYRMQKIILFSVFVFNILNPIQTWAQIQPGCVNANFGVDADLHANQFQFGGFLNPSGKDDWFKSSLYSGSGLGVLDTTGAYSLYSFYASGGSLNKIFLRRANTTFFQTANNTIQVDALMARDYYGGSGYM